jgi:hypothetical protein
MAVVVVDHGTALQLAQVHQAAADAPDQTALDQTVILDQTTVEIKIMAVEVFKVKDFQAVMACAIIVKAKTVIEQVAVAVLVVRGILAKMIVIKAC